MFDFSILVLEGAYGTSVSATLDILRAAVALAPLHAAPTPTWRVCSLSSGRVRLDSGLLVETLKLPKASAADTSMWIVPGLALNTPDEVAASAGRADLLAAAQAVAAHVKRGGRVA